MKNFEKIMQEMTVEKLAIFLDCRHCSNNPAICKCGDADTCNKMIKKWLEQEADK